MSEDDFGKQILEHLSKNPEISKAVLKTHDRFKEYFKLFFQHGCFDTLKDKQREAFKKVSQLLDDPEFYQKCKPKPIKKIKRTVFSSERFQNLPALSVHNQGNENTVDHNQDFNHLPPITKILRKEFLKLSKVRLCNCSDYS